MTLSDTSTTPQNMLALAQGNRVRLARAELKRRIDAGDVDVAAIILVGHWAAESMTVFDLLVAQHRWGRTRALRLLATVPLGELKTVGGLTRRQRATLAARLRGESNPHPWPTEVFA